jgi:hypothetical protein
MPEDDLRRRLLEALAHLLPELIEPVVVPVPARPVADPPAAAAPAPKLRRIHRQLLAKASATPVPTKKLIALAGYPVNTYSRDAVTQLCRAGLLVRTPDGVRLPAGSQEDAR